MTNRTYSAKRIYRWPLLLAVITLCGLLSALFGDGFWDELSWFALAIPLVVIIWSYSRVKNMRSE